VATDCSLVKPIAPRKLRKLDPVLFPCSIVKALGAKAVNHL